jgi:hypothetical protein
MKIWPDATIAARMVTTATTEGSSGEPKPLRRRLSMSRSNIAVIASHIAAVNHTDEEP